MDGDPVMNFKRMNSVRCQSSIYQRLRSVRKITNLVAFLLPSPTGGKSILAEAVLDVGKVHILPGLVLSATAKKVTTTSTVDVTTSNNSGPSSWTTTDGVDLDRVRTLDASFGKTNASDAWETEPAIIRSLGTPQADGSTSIKHQSIECAVHSWHDFTACSVTCGGGIKTAKHHSTSCPFDVYHQTCCNTQPCEGEGTCVLVSMRSNLWLRYFSLLLITSSE